MCMLDVNIFNAYYGIFAFSIPGIALVFKVTSAPVKMHWSYFKQSNSTRRNMHKPMGSQPDRSNLLFGGIIILKGYSRFAKTPG